MGSQGGFVVFGGRKAASVLRFPRASLRCLEAVLPLDFHEYPVGCHHSKQLGHFLPHFGLSFVDIFDEQIHDVFSVGPQSDIDPAFPGELVDQKNQRADASAELTVGFLLLFLDGSSRIRECGCCFR